MPHGHLLCLIVYNSLAIILTKVFVLHICIMHNTYVHMYRDNMFMIYIHVHTCMHVCIRLCSEIYIGLILLM